MIEHEERDADKPFVFRWSKVSIEDEILELLDRPLLDGSRELAFRVRERELAQVFARLPSIEARELHRRLSNPAPEDPIAARFGRMVFERRQRLLGVLADARRREAVARARGQGG